MFQQTHIKQLVFHLDFAGCQSDGMICLTVTGMIPVLPTRGMLLFIQKSLAL